MDKSNAYWRADDGPPVFDAGRLAPLCEPEETADFAPEYTESARDRFERTRLTPVRIWRPGDGSRYYLFDPTAHRLSARRLTEINGAEYDTARAAVDMLPEQTAAALRRIQEQAQRRARDARNQSKGTADDSGCPF